MRRLLAFALLALGLMAGTAQADDYGTRVAAEVARTNVWVNTASYTPPVYDEWSTACGLQRVTMKGWVYSQTIQDRWNAVPLPCYFKASPGTDQEAVLRWHGSSSLDYYEFWGAHWECCGGWYARWGGGADETELKVDASGVRTWPSGMGTQASGIAFIPGLLMLSELQAGRIGHVVAMEVPEACGYYQPPAARTDGWGTMATNTHCLPYGTLLKLPPTAVAAPGASTFARMIVQAAKDYGLMVTDQTHDTVAFRGENWHRPYAPWGSTNPYIAVFDGKTCDQAGGYKGCPDKLNQLAGVPWGQLYKAN